MEPDYEQINNELFEAAGYPSDWCLENEDIAIILEKHFMQFEKEILAGLDKTLQDVGPWVVQGVQLGVFPTCPGIADSATKVATFIPAPPGSLLEAIRKGAENPIVKGDDKCPVCANGTDICSYCAKNFEE